MQDAGTTMRTRSRSWVCLAGPLSTGLGWAAHVAGGGQSPAVLVVVALAALLGMAAAMVGPRWLPVWAVLVAAGLAQQLLHLGFSAFSSASGFVLPGQHGHGGTPVPDAQAGRGQPGASQDLHLMLYLHTGAALLSAFLAGRLARITQRSTTTQDPTVDGRSGRERAADDADA